MDKNDTAVLKRVSLGGALTLFFQSSSFWVVWELGIVLSLINLQWLGAWKAERYFWRSLAVFIVLERLLRWLLNY